MLVKVYLKIFFSDVYLFLRETETECEWVGAEREQVTEWEAGSRLWAVSTVPDVGLELTDHEIVTWAEVGRLSDWATQEPLKLTFNVENFKHKEKVVKTRS